MRETYNSSLANNPDKPMETQEIKKIEFEILCDVDSFCRENDITYFLGYGTLIGAVRHQGFIPWDDDIDIIMPRPDYDRFISTYSPKKTERPYEVIDGSNTRCKTVFAKVYDPSTIKIEAGCDYRRNNAIGVDIDVFPIDGIPDDSKTLSILYRRIKLLNICFTLCVLLPRQNIAKRVIQWAAKCFGQRFWYRRINKEARRSKYQGSPKVGMIVKPFQGYDDIHDSSVFQDSKEMLFGGKRFPVPIGYHAYLTQLYGDYMKLPEVEQQKTHHSNECYRK